MSTVTVSLPDLLAELLRREASQRSVTQDVIVRRALERALPQDSEAGDIGVFEKLRKLVVNDPASPVDLATSGRKSEST